MQLIRFLIPKVEYILFGAVFWGVVVNGARILNFDGDLPRHILMGNLILQTREVTTTDVFSFRTTGYPSYPHEWLSQVILALADRWLGLSGIVLVTALIIMLTWSIVYYRTIRQSKSFFTSLLFVALAIGASQIHVLPRPHIFTYLLTTVWIVLLERIEENRLHAKWLLPPVMLLWVNLHGMFVVGIIIWGIYLVGDFLDRPSRAWFSSAKAKALIIGGVLSLAATLLSPSGPRIWSAIASLGTSEYITSRIPEYQSANFHLPETWPFLLILFCILIGFARTTGKISWIHLLIVITFTGLALYSSRMIPVFAIVVTPIGAKAFANWIRNEHTRSRFSIGESNVHRLNSSSNGLIWLLVLISAVAMLFSSGTALDLESRGNLFDDRFFPVQAVLWLQHHPQEGHMFNEFDWGGYLLLQLWPAHQIFMDGHTHIYGDELTREYEKIITLDKDWQDLLRKYDVRWVIIRSSEPLAHKLRKDLNWEVVYQDETAIILNRR